MSTTPPHDPADSPSSSVSDAGSSPGPGHTSAADEPTATATPNALKRKRCSSALTPPLSASDACHAPTLSRALHVLATEATALSHITRLYETSPTAKSGLVAAVDMIESAHRAGGKVLVCGVGKSGLVGRKTVATMKSLGLGASFLHAAEAVHGDLGDVRDNDAVLFISFSGRTAELLNLLPHIAAHVPVVALTAHTEAEKCPLLAGRANAVLLPAPIHESEEASFGVSAPTTSTTVAMAIGDMLAITAAERIHEGSASRVFKKNHPGGAIGAKTVAEGRAAATPAKKVCSEKGDRH